MALAMTLCVSVRLAAIRLAAIRAGTRNPMTARILLDGLFRTAIAAAHPASCLPPHLPAPPAAGRLIVLAPGKAAGAMTEGAAQHYPDRGKFAPDRLTGVAGARHGDARPGRPIRV